MNNLLRVFGMTLCLFGALPSMADEARLQNLISQAEAALARDDRQSVDRLIDEIYSLTTGLDPALEGKPEHLSNADYEKRLCPFRQATTPLLTAQELEYLHHEMRLAAYSIVQAKEENAPYIQTTIECVQANGEPVPEALALIKGIEWARKLASADINELRAMAQEYEELIQRHPDNQLYEVLNSIIDMHADNHRLDGLTKETHQLLTEGILYQSNLVEKADKGDLALQLEVAHRLETGDKFRQDHRFAYFWYKRALQNGGGEPAQNGLDRLHPQLDWLDHELVDMWLRKKHRPY